VTSGGRRHVRARYWCGTRRATWSARRNPRRVRARDLRSHV